MGVLTTIYNFSTSWEQYSRIVDPDEKKSKIFSEKSELQPLYLQSFRTRLFVESNRLKEIGAQRPKIFRRVQHFVDDKRLWKQRSCDPQRLKKECQAACKILHVFQQTIEKEDRSDSREESVQFAKLQVDLASKLFDLYGDSSETVHSLLSEIDFVPSALSCIKANPSGEKFLLMSRLGYGATVLDSLFSQRDFETVQALLKEEVSQMEIASLFQHGRKEVLSSLVRLAEEKTELRPAVFRLLCLCFDKTSQETSAYILDCMRNWKTLIDPEAELVPGKRLSALFCSCTYPDEDHAGPLAQFLSCDESTASSLELCQNFLALPRIQSFAPSIRAEHFPLRFNIVEAAFFFSVPRKQMTTIVPSLSLLESEVSKVEKQVNAHFFEQYLCSFWKVDTRHIQKQFVQSPKDIPEGISIETLLDFYDEMTGRRRDVVISQEGSVENARSNLRKDVWKTTCPPGSFFIRRQSLERVVGRIQRREAFLATPPEGTPALEDWYKTVEIHFCHTIRVLQEKYKKDQSLKTQAQIWAFFDEIDNASDHCGARYYEVAVEEYFKVFDQRAVDRSLASLRKTLFEQKVFDYSKQNSFTRDHNVHFLNQALKDHGTRWGLPQTEAAQRYHDVLGHDSIPNSVIDDFFKSEYTVRCIVSWLRSANETDQQWRELFLDHVRHRRPVEWKRDLYSPLIKTIQKIQSDGKKRVYEKNQEMEALLKEKNITWSPRESLSAEQAILHHQTHDFLAEYVHDSEYSIHFMAIMRLLSDMGVVHCRLNDDVEVFPKRIRSVSSSSEFFAALGGCAGDVASIVSRAVGSFFEMVGKTFGCR